MAINGRWWAVCTLALALAVSGCDDGDGGSGGGGGSDDGGLGGGSDGGGDPVCGDGRVEGDETCDDGNTDPGDGCDARCREEFAPEICDNGLDDDEDGQTDCDDAECDDEPGCVPPTEDCANGSDDDGDGDADCDDSDCARAPACRPPVEDCDNGQDDDGDGNFDCTDDDCADDPACEEPPAEICDNGQDDDGDGDTDCDDDRDCALDPACQTPEEICDNGADEDGDDLIDCADDDCAGHPDCAEPTEICDNGGDDDGDMAVDCDDDDCLGHPACGAGGEGTCEAPLAVVVGGRVDGTTVGSPDAATAQCGGGAQSAENVHVFVPEAAGVYCVTTARSAYDTVLHVRTACADAASEIACNDDNEIAGGTRSALELDAVAGTPYFIYVDGYGASVGAYQLRVLPGACVELPECEADGDCDGGVCFEGACVECADDAHCDDGVCESNACVECRDDAGCGEGFCVENACVQCREEADCGEGDACFAGFCVPAVAATCETPRAGGFGDFVGATRGEGGAFAASCGGDADGPEDVFALRFEQAGAVCITTTGSSFDTVLHVRTACGDIESEIACNDDNFGVTGGTQSALELNAEAGVDYFVFVDGFAEASGGLYRLHVAPGPCVEPPECEADDDCFGGEFCVEGQCVACRGDEDCGPGRACNDEGTCESTVTACRQPPQLGIGFGGFTRVRGNLAEAVDEAEASCGGADGAEFAYLFNLFGSGRFCASAVGEGLQPVLSVRGACEDAASEVACGAPVEGAAQIEFETEAGAAAFLFVDSAEGNGEYVLTISEGGCDERPACFEDVDCGEGEGCLAGACVPVAAPVACDAPRAIAAGETVDGTTAGAVAASAGSCGGNGSPESVFVFRPDAEGEYCLQTTGSSIDTVMYVRTGDCAEGDEVACNDDNRDVTGGVASAITLQAGAETDYFVFVDAFGDDNVGSYRLAVTAGACPILPECAADDECLGDDVCVDGQCVQCRDDAGCEEGLVCDGGRCQSPVLACRDVEPLPLNRRVRLSTADAPADQSGSCGGEGGELVFGLDFLFVETVCVSLEGSSFDTVAYARRSCEDADSEVACADDQFEGEELVSTDALLELNLADDLRFLFVDGGDGGDLVLTVTEGGCDERPACLEDTDCGEGQACRGGSCEAVEPAGTCDEPIALEVGQTVEGSTANAPSLYEATCGGSAASPEAIFSFTAPAAGAYCVSTRGSDYDTVLHIRGTCADLLTQIACNDDNAEVNGPDARRTSAITVDAEAGVAYAVFVDGFGEGSAGNFAVTVTEGPCLPAVCRFDEDCPGDLVCDEGACVPAPPGCESDEDCDEGETCVDGACVALPPPVAACEAPLDLALGVTEGNLVDSAAGTRGSCGGNGPEVAYAITVDAETTFCANTAGSEADTILYVRAGDCAAGEEVACNDDAEDADAFESEVEFVAAPGTTYYLFVDTFRDGEPFALTVTDGPCGPAPECAVDGDCDEGELCVDGACVAAPECVEDGDCAEGEICDDGECVAAPVLAACVAPPGLELGVTEGDLTLAGADTRGSCGGNGVEVAYAIAVDAETTFCATTAGSTADTVLYVRAGDCADGEEVTCNDDAEDADAFESEVEFVAAAGTTYYLFVDTFQGGDGFVLTVTEGPCGVVAPRAPAPGELVVTEIMQNPLAVDDRIAEWFEVYNAADAPIEMAGLVFYDTHGNRFEVAVDSLVAEPGDYVVFSRNGNAATNGGVAVDYAYDGAAFNMANTSDEIYLARADDTLIDVVAWDNGRTFPDPDGASMQFDADLDPASDDNALGANWCEATSVYGAGDRGTPGAANTSCNL